MKKLLGHLLLILSCVFVTYSSAGAVEQFTISASVNPITEGGIVGANEDSLGSASGSIISTLTISTPTAATSGVTTNASISGGCKVVTATKGPGTLSNETSAAIYLSYSAYAGLTKGVISVYHPDTSSYEGNRTCTVTFSATQSADPAFNGLSIPSKSITVADNETAPTPPPSSPKSSNTTQTKKPTNATAEQVEEVIKPEVPTTALLDAEGNALKPDEEGGTIVFKENEPIKIGGTTVANGIVKLYIFSTPREATVTADANGVWTYEIEAIEAGDHHVEIEVTDPATGQTSTRQQVLAFAVSEAEKNIAAADTPIVANESKKNSNFLIIVGAGASVFAALIGGVVWWLKRKRKILHKTTLPLDPEASDIQKTSDERKQRPEDF